MTRFLYDQFAKDFLKELLTPLGEVETSRNVAGEVREIDVWFTPHPAETRGNAEVLGLLGRFASQAAIFEPFRNAVTASQIRGCLSKLFDPTFRTRNCHTSTKSQFSSTEELKLNQS